MINIHVEKHLKIKALKNKHKYHSFANSTKCPSDEVLILNINIIVKFTYTLDQNIVS